MKTLSQILELYKPKSQDEDKFVKKHIVVKHRDRNGNGDPVFQATNIKAVDREKERHGYEPGKDEEVYEETEDHATGKRDADEAMNRHDEAMKSIEKAKGTKQAPKDPQFQEHMKKYNAAMDKYNYHHNAIRNMKEETEHLEEKLKVSDGIGAWISDFVHSKNPKFDGFSKRKRMKMAQAAFYSAQEGD